MSTVAIPLHLGRAALVVASIAGLFGCEVEDSSLSRRKEGIPDTQNADGGADGGYDDETVDPATLACNAPPAARSYLAFDGTHLEANRVNEGLGVNRVRQKPFDVLAGEYQRVIGVVPKELERSGGSFDVAPDRWFTEPSLSAVSLNAMFDLSFSGCLEYTQGSAEFESLPTTESATKTCTSLARKAWSRSATPEEIDTCVELALHGVEGESNPRRRWAYVCASVLSSSAFLTY